MPLWVDWDEARASWEDETSRALTQDWMEGDDDPGGFAPWDFVRGLTRGVLDSVTLGGYGLLFPLSSGESTIHKVGRYVGEVAGFLIPMGLAAKAVRPVVRAGVRATGLLREGSAVASVVDRGVARLVAPVVRSKIWGSADVPGRLIVADLLDNIIEPAVSLGVVQATQHLVGGALLHGYLSTKEQEERVRFLESLRQRAQAGDEAAAHMLSLMDPRGAIEAGLEGAPLGAIYGLTGVLTRPFFEAVAYKVGGGAKAFRDFIPRVNTILRRQEKALRAALEQGRGLWDLAERTIAERYMLNLHRPTQDIFTHIQRGLLLGTWGDRLSALRPLLGLAVADWLSFLPASMLVMGLHGNWNPIDVFVGDAAWQASAWGLNTLARVVFPALRNHILWSPDFAWSRTRRGLLRWALREMPSGEAQRILSTVTSDPVEELMRRAGHTWPLRLYSSTYRSAALDVLHLREAIDSASRGPAAEATARQWVAHFLGEQGRHLLQQMRAEGRGLEGIAEEQGAQMYMVTAGMGALQALGRMGDALARGIQRGLVSPRWVPYLLEAVVDFAAYGSVVTPHVARMEELASLIPKLHPTGEHAWGESELRALAHWNAVSWFTHVLQDAVVGAGSRTAKIQRGGVAGEISVPQVISDPDGSATRMLMQKLFIEGKLADLSPVHQLAALMWLMETVGRLEVDGTWERMSPEERIEALARALGPDPRRLRHLPPEDRERYRAYRTYAAELLHALAGGMEALTQALSVQEVLRVWRIAGIQPDEETIHLWETYREAERAYREGRTARPPKPLYVKTFHGLGQVVDARLLGIERIGDLHIARLQIDVPVREWGTGRGAQTTPIVVWKPLFTYAWQDPETGSAFVFRHVFRSAEQVREWAKAFFSMAEAGYDDLLRAGLGAQLAALGADESPLRAVSQALGLGDASLESAFALAGHILYLQTRRPEAERRVAHEVFEALAKAYRAAAERADAVREWTRGGRMDTALMDALSCVWAPIHGVIPDVGTLAAEALRQAFTVGGEDTVKHAKVFVRTADVLEAVAKTLRAAPGEVSDVALRVSGMQVEGLRDALGLRLSEIEGEGGLDRVIERLRMLWREAPDEYAHLLSRLQPGGALHVWPESVYRQDVVRTVARSMGLPRRAEEREFTHRWRIAVAAGMDALLHDLEAPPLSVQRLARVWGLDAEERRRVTAWVRRRDEMREQIGRIISEIEAAGEALGKVGSVLRAFTGPADVLSGLRGAVDVGEHIQRVASFLAELPLEDPASAVDAVLWWYALWGAGNKALSMRVPTRSAEAGEWLRPGEWGFVRVPAMWDRMKARGVDLLGVLNELIGRALAVRGHTVSDVGAYLRSLGIQDADLSGAGLELRPDGSLVRARRVHTTSGKRKRQVVRVVPLDEDVVLRMVHAVAEDYLDAYGQAYKMASLHRDPGKRAEALAALPPQAVVYWFRPGAHGTEGLSMREIHAKLASWVDEWAGKLERAYGELDALEQAVASEPHYVQRMWHELQATGKRVGHKIDWGVLASIEPTRRGEWALLAADRFVARLGEKIEEAVARHRNPEETAGWVRGTVQAALRLRRGGRASGSERRLLTALLGSLADAHVLWHGRFRKSHVKYSPEWWIATLLRKYFEWEPHLQFGVEGGGVHTIADLTLSMLDTRVVEFLMSERFLERLKAFLADYIGGEPTHEVSERLRARANVPAEALVHTVAAASDLRAAMQRYRVVQGVLSSLLAHGNVELLHRLLPRKGGGWRAQKRMYRWPDVEADEAWRGIVQAAAALVGRDVSKPEALQAVWDDLRRAVVDLVYYASVVPAPERVAPRVLAYARGRKAIPHEDLTSAVATLLLPFAVYEPWALAQRQPDGTLLMPDKLSSGTLRAAYDAGQAVREMSQAVLDRAWDEFAAPIRESLAHGREKLDASGTDPEELRAVLTRYDDILHAMRVLAPRIVSTLAAYRLMAAWRHEREDMDLYRRRLLPAEVSESDITIGDALETLARDLWQTVTRVGRVRDRKDAHRVHEQAERMMEVLNAVFVRPKDPLDPITAHFLRQVLTVGKLDETLLRVRMKGPVVDPAWVDDVDAVPMFGYTADASPFVRGVLARLLRSAKAAYALGYHIGRYGGWHVPGMRMRAGSERPIEQMGIFAQLHDLVREEDARRDPYSVLDFIVGHLPALEEEPIVRMYQALGRAMLLHDLRRFSRFRAGLARVVTASDIDLIREHLVEEPAVIAEALQGLRRWAPRRVDALIEAVLAGDVRGLKEVKERLQEILDDLHERVEKKEGKGKKSAIDIAEFAYDVGRITDHVRSVADRYLQDRLEALYQQDQGVVYKEYTRTLLGLWQEGERQFHRVGARDQEKTWLARDVVAELAEARQETPGFLQRLIGFWRRTAVNFRPATILNNLMSNWFMLYPMAVAQGSLKDGHIDMFFHPDAPSGFTQNLQRVLGLAEKSPAVLNVLAGALGTGMERFGGLIGQEFVQVLRAMTDRMRTDAPGGFGTAAMWALALPMNVAAWTVSLMDRKLRSSWTQAMRMGITPAEWWARLGNEERLALQAAQRDPAWWDLNYTLADMPLRMAVFGEAIRRAEARLKRRFVDLSDAMSEPTVWDIWNAELRPYLPDYSRYDRRVMSSIGQVVPFLGWRLEAARILSRALVERPRAALGTLLYRIKLSWAVLPVTSVLAALQGDADQDDTLRAEHEYLADALHQPFLWLSNLGSIPIPVTVHTPDGATVLWLDASNLLIGDEWLPSANPLEANPLARAFSSVGGPLRTVISVLRGETAWGRPIVEEGDSVVERLLRQTIALAIYGIPVAADAARVVRDVMHAWDAALSREEPFLGRAKIVGEPWAGAPVVGVAAELARGAWNLGLVPLPIPMGRIEERSLAPSDNYAYFTDVLRRLKAKRTSALRDVHSAYLRAIEAGDMNAALSAYEEAQRVYRRWTREILRYEALRYAYAYGDEEFIRGLQ